MERALSLPTGCKWTDFGSDDDRQKGAQWGTEVNEQQFARMKDA